MSFFKQLEAMEWNDFSTYPKQDSCIYLKCVGEDGSRYFKINHFNAVSFNVKKVHPELDFTGKWAYFWLPSHEVDIIKNRSLSTK